MLCLLFGAQYINVQKPNPVNFSRNSYIATPWDQEEGCMTLHVTEGSPRHDLSQHLNNTFFSSEIAGEKQYPQLFMFTQ